MPAGGGVYTGPVIANEIERYACVSALLAIRNRGVLLTRSIVLSAKLKLNYSDLDLSGAT
jgi:hypothetical protein